MQFDELGLRAEILKAIQECGYTTPTPIQEKAIPHILMTRDLVGLAQTGTGKTASFTLPMIEILAGGKAKARMPRSLILAPTRELAAQVGENFETYGKHCKLSKALLVGGESVDEQIKALNRGVDVLIATPGRLLDLFDRGAILLNDIRILVIDEADRMLDMGFIPDIEKIVSLLPPMRQTLLFSATMPPEIRKLTNRFLSNPKEVSVDPPASTAEKVEQFLVWTHPKDKQKVLDAIIQQEDVQNAFVFCNRKKDIGGLTRWLENHNYAARALHGDMPQSQRTLTLEEFKEGRIALLVCSDVAARGLDVQAMSHVFNYDVPTHADDYVHRIGRTGRAGKSGRAWTLATPAEEKYVDAIEKRIRKPVPVETIEGFKAHAPQGGKAAGDGKKAESKPRQAPSPVREEKSAPSKKTARPSKARKPKQHESGDNDNITGFGEEVPAFFTRKS